MGERQRLGAQDALWLERDEPGNLMAVDSLFWTAEAIAGAAPGPRRASLTGQALVQATSLAGSSLQLARGTVTNPVGAAHSALTLTESLVGAVGSRAHSARETSRSAPVRGCHPKVKQVAHAHGATVNDVLVTCVAESLRACLEQHRSVCHSVTWDVPVNLKPFDPSLPVVLGNSFRSSSSSCRRTSTTRRGRSTSSGTAWTGSSTGTRRSWTSASRRSSPG
jgi:hypothetical protein